MAINKRFQDILDGIRLEEKKLDEYESDIKITFLGDILSILNKDEKYKLNKQKLLDQREKVDSISCEFDRRTFYGLRGVLTFLERSISIVEGKIYYFVRLKDFSGDNEKSFENLCKDLMFDVSKSGNTYIVMPEDCILDLNLNIREGKLKTVGEVDDYLTDKCIKHITFPAFEDVLFFSYGNHYDEESYDHVPSNIVRDFPYLENLITDFLAYSYDKKDERNLDKMNEYLSELAFKCCDEDTKKMIKTF